MHDDSLDALASVTDAQVRRTVRRNDRNAVHEVVVDGRLAALKTTDATPAVLAREAAVARRVARQTPVPVPEVLDEGNGALLLAWAEGDPYGPDAPLERRRARLAAVGRTLARLHGSTATWFDGHGDLEPGGGSLAIADPAPWPRRFEGFLEAWATSLDARDADIAAAVREYVGAHRDAFADADPVLVHGEPGPEHVRFDGPDLSAVLDWELSQAAPGEFDLAWAELEFLDLPFHADTSGAPRAALRRGYEAERPLPPGSAWRRRVYRAAFAMRALKHADGAAEGCEASAAEVRDAMRSRAFGLLDDADAVAPVGEVGR